MLRNQQQWTWVYCTSKRANFSSASSGVMMASIGGISSSLCAAWTLLSVDSAANCAAKAAFFSSFIFLTSRFCKRWYKLQKTVFRTLELTNNWKGRKNRKKIFCTHTLFSKRASVVFSLSSTFFSSSVICNHIKEIYSISTATRKNLLNVTCHMQEPGIGMICFVLERFPYFRNN